MAADSGLRTNSICPTGQTCPAPPAAIDGPYTALRRSLHFLILQIGYKTDKVTK